jgi:hypothetical protein
VSAPAFSLARPNYESPSWEKMSAQSRRLVAAAAGFTNVHQLNRIQISEWAAMFDHERKALYRVNWKNVIARQERRRG